jgi:hypothetical protein
MARLYVYSDNLTARVELIQGPVDAIWRAYCIGCVADDLLSGTHEGFGLEDAAEAAGMHTPTGAPDAPTLTAAPSVATTPVTGAGRETD